MSASVGTHRKHGFGVGLALALAAPSIATATPTEFRATLIAAYSDRACVLLPDSAVAPPGARVTLVARGGSAAGVVIALADGRVAVVRILEGSLPGRRTIPVRMRIETPPGSPVTLRLGVPRAEQALPDSIPGYAPAAGDFTRWTRLGPAGEGPDTLLLRTIADPADREIALERGELDAALFPAGELSARLRGDGRWIVLPAPGRGDVVGTAAAEPSLRALGADRLLGPEGRR